jgi:hypothetical protein
MMLVTTRTSSASAKCRLAPLWYGGFEDHTQALANRRRS